MRTSDCRFERAISSSASKKLAPAKNAVRNQNDRSVLTATFNPVKLFSQMLDCPFGCIASFWYELNVLSISEIFDLIF